ncbi:MAG: hypothetical protein GJU73_04005 [Ferrovum sp.]|jgi:hypothetical protein|uniref:hypothetical protein n=1 Tax=Ferrovum sp. TaxID=2609467 RepID=UPI0026204785|nr:hypothetical protein [Ferrovum sp.]MBW8066588.1 hypothetical protein [Ferrovum sp.]
MAEEQWKQRRSDRVNISGKDGLLNQPRSALLDKSAYVVMFTSWASKEAEVTFEDLKSEKKNQISTTKLDFFENFDNFDNIPDDAPFIAVYFGKRSAVKVTGPYERISSLDRKISYPNKKEKGTLQIVRKVDLILGYSLDSRTKKVIENHLKTLKDEFSSKLKDGTVIKWADAFATDRQQ